MHDMRKTLFLINLLFISGVSLAQQLQGIVKSQPAIRFGFPFYLYICKNNERYFNLFIDGTAPGSIMQAAGANRPLWFLLLPVFAHLRCPTTSNRHMLLAFHANRGCTVHHSVMFFAILDAIANNQVFSVESPLKLSNFSSDFM